MLMKKLGIAHVHRFLSSTELMFVETSALTGENVEEVFLKCSRTILAKIESGESRLVLFVYFCLRVIWILSHFLRYIFFTQNESLVLTVGVIVKC